MLTIEELKVLTEQGKVLKQKEEERKREEAARKEREKRMEQAVKDVARAQQHISTLEEGMKSAALEGRSSLRVCHVSVENVSDLAGELRIVVDHFKKLNFLVDIELERVLDYDSGEPYHYKYLRISW